MTTRIKLTSVLVAAIFFTVTAACNNGDSATTAASSGNQTAAVAQAAPATQQQPQPQLPVADPEPAASIPDFTFFVLKSGIRFTKEDLAKSGNRVFIFFDPTCSHCQHEANELGKNYDSVKDVHLYFVSMNDPALMASFLDTWAKPLVGQENVEVLYDRGAEFINKFHLPSQYPATYVYGADGALKEYWNGERNTNEIIAAMNQ